MFLKRFLYIFLAIFSFQVVLYSLDHPQLLLHFDMNKTIIASDIASGKSREDVIVHSLADSYKYMWGPEMKRPLSYSDYVKEYLLPGSSTDLQLKQIRDKKISGFLAFLEKNNPELYQRALADFEDALKALQNQKTLVFTSFYSLIDFLRENGYEFSVIIRTFGKELDQVASEIEEKAHIHFSKKAHFEKTILYVDDNGSLSTMSSIYTFLKKNRNVAIQDDWKYWFEHNSLQEYGKPFPLDPKDAATLSLFFDDNIDSGEGVKKNIVNPIDVLTRTSLNVTNLVHQYLIFPVDTIQAIKDDAYYVHLVTQALNTHALSTGSNEATSTVGE